MYIYEKSTVPTGRPTGAVEKGNAVDLATCTYKNLGWEGGGGKGG